MRKHCADCAGPCAEPCAGSIAGFGVFGLCALKVLMVSLFRRRVGVLCARSQRIVST